MDTIFKFSSLHLSIQKKVFQDIFITFGIWGIHNSYFTTRIIISAKVHTMSRAGTVEPREQREGQCIPQSRDMKEVGYLGQHAGSQPKQIIQLHLGLSVNSCSATGTTGENRYLIFASWGSICSHQVTIWLLAELTYQLIFQRGGDNSGIKPTWPCWKYPTENWQNLISFAEWKCQFLSDCGAVRLQVQFTFQPPGHARHFENKNNFLPKFPVFQTHRGIHYAIFKCLLFKVVLKVASWTESLTYQENFSISSQVDGVYLCHTKYLMSQCSASCQHAFTHSVPLRLKSIFELLNSIGTWVEIDDIFMFPFIG